MWVLKDTKTGEVVLIASRREDCLAYEQTQLDNTRYVVEYVDVKREIDND